MEQQEVKMEVNSLNFFVSWVKYTCLYTGSRNANGHENYSKIKQILL